MITVILSIILFVLMLLAGMFYRIYSAVPISELKRRARAGDVQASMLHAVARNQKLVRLYLNGLALGCFAVLCVLISKNVDTLQAVAAVVLVLMAWFFAVSKNQYVRPLAVRFASYFSTFLVKTRPYAGLVLSPFKRFMNTKELTQLYEMDDLLELLKKQQSAINNRIEKSELEMARHVLTFGEKLVKDYMTPRKVVYFVDSLEPVGPILISELHESGFSRFPVFTDTTDNIVGTLYLKDLVDKRTSGKVFSVMSKEVAYVNENQTLRDALEAFLKTKHHLSMVQNEHSEIVGIITFEDVLEQMLGRKIADETDVHEDMRDFAAEK